MQSHPQPTDAVAYYARVSQPTQKLEQQWTIVSPWLAEQGITIPTALQFCDKGYRRHEASTRPAFQRLLAIAAEGRLDWVVIASFDRWGCADVDDFFYYRRELKNAGVRLWSVQDLLELTSVDDRDFSIVIGKAQASSQSMKNHAGHILRKMIDMALNGWHASAQHPYGTDLLCCRLSDRQPIFRVHLLDNTRKKQVWKIIDCQSGKETITTKMPPRDKDTTGYRLAPSIDTARIEAVKLIYDCYCQGLSIGAIADYVESLGYTFFGRHFTANVIVTILENPTYTGYLVWGKYQHGQYKVLGKGGKIIDTPPKKKTDLARPQRPIEECVTSREQIFEPIITSEQFDMSQKILHEKSVGRQHKRDPRIHYLNGLVCCPDCGAAMVSSWGTKRNGTRQHYFVCGRYAHSRSKLCRANSVATDLLDMAAEQVLSRVKAKLSDLATIDTSNLKNSLTSELRKNNSVVAGFLSDLIKALQEKNSKVLYTGKTKKVNGVKVHVLKDSLDYDDLVSEYERLYADGGSEKQARIVEIDAELHKLGDLLETLTSPTLAKRWQEKIDLLENEKTLLASQSDNLANQFRQQVRLAGDLVTRLVDLEQVEKSLLWKTFLQKVIPIMDVKILTMTL